MKPKPKERVPRAYFCGCMITVDLAVLIYSIYLNGWTFESFNRNPMLGPSTSVLTQMGAKDTPLIRHGQWYRLLSAMFLHAGIAHFCFNSFSLWRVGKPLEELYGPWRIALLFLVSGLSGNMLSEPDPARPQCPPCLARRRSPGLRRSKHRAQTNTHSRTLHSDRLLSADPDHCW
jgi:membrane associated rhomboid family serine protease